MSPFTCKSCPITGVVGLRVGGVSKVLDLQAEKPKTNSFPRIHLNYAGMEVW